MYIHMCIYIHNNTYVCMYDAEQSEELSEKLRPMQGN